MFKLSVYIVHQNCIFVQDKYLTSSIFGCSHFPSICGSTVAEVKTSYCNYYLLAIMLLALSSLQSDQLNAAFCTVYRVLLWKNNLKGKY